jgi:hypothetical protein
VPAASMSATLSLLSCPQHIGISLNMKQDRTGNNKQG